MDDLKQPKSTHASKHDQTAHQFEKIPPGNLVLIRKSRWQHKLLNLLPVNIKRRIFRVILKLSRYKKNYKTFYKKHRLGVRVSYGFMAILMMFTVLYQVISPRFKESSYDISAKAEKLLGGKVDLYAKSISYNAKEAVFEYNKGYQPGSEVGGQVSGPKFSASFYSDTKKGITLEDVVNKSSFGFVPKYRIGEPKQIDSRIVYPLIGKNGVKVYTLKAGSIKEDIILNSYSRDNLEFSYELKLDDGTEARLEADGSLGIYGISGPLLGDVSTGSENDVQLLKKARDNAEKTQLLFRIPAPFIRESGNHTSTAKTWYSLKENVLTIHANNLKFAKYPLTIDPTIYVETASKFMRGNNETNIDFDVDNELIQKGKTTGARFDSWTSTLALPSARWNHATTVAGGYIYVSGGSSGSTNQTTVYWAKLNTSTYAIESPNPGAGACANWCNSSAYDLPAARAGHSMVAYNGFLYVLGGLNTTPARTSTVYIAKIGANGEPSLWHPTDTNKNNWVYWFPSTVSLSVERSYAAAAAYNNRIYLLGGQTNAATGGVTTVEYATLTPLGTFGSWTTTGMVALPSARHNHTVQIYNDRMYLIGGNSSGVLQSGVSFIKLSSTGIMSGSWQSTTAFTTARMAWGGSFSTIWGGYLYVQGGCTAINGSGHCTTIASDVQLASINADGTITDWGTITGVTSSRIGFGLVAWRNTIYGIGGCTAHNTSTGVCTTTATLTQYGAVKTDGEASTVSNSVASGVAPCLGATPFDCDMPPEGTGTGQGGRMSGNTVINNGFIYYIGGCQAVGSGNICFTGSASKTADNVSYSTINVDGSLGKPSTCSGTYYGSWCVDNTNTPNANSGLAGFGVTVFNNVIYAVGGTDGTDWQANVWRTALASNGSIGTWTSQTYANLDLGSFSGYQFVFSRANPSSASTYPGNLYVVGGCAGALSTDNGLDCTSTQYTTVYKCNIKNDGSLEDADANDCTTTGQLQIDAEPGTGGNQGLGVMAGAVYANYIYLIGGQSPNQGERGEVMYAQIDSSNNIVAVSGGIWQTSGNSISPVRKRGVAFGYNGYLYALAGYNVTGGGSLNDLLFAKIDVSNGSIGAWTTSVVTVNARWDLRAIVSNGYVYTMGGCTAGVPPQNCTSMTGTLQTFQLYNNYSGSPNAYSAGANLFATDRIGASATVLNGYMYVAGGCTSATDCTTATTDVQYAAIDSYGALGSWSTASNVLPAVRAWGQLETAGGFLYYLGGQDSTATNEQSTVYYVGTFSSGNISAAWSTASGGIGDTNSQAAQARTKFSATVWNNRIYVVGGLDGSAAVSSTVFVTPSLSSGGNIAADSWASSTAFNIARSGTTAISYGNNLYILGGYDGTNYLNDVQYTQINSDGTVDAWIYSASLPGKLANGDGFAANGYMYLLGGRSADTTCESNTIAAPISANTTIASGNNPTGVGDWYETNVKYSGNRYGAAAVYNDGKAYVLGGGCGATITYTGANRIVQTTMQSQPQVAKYSRMIDTDTDVFPTKFLLNGLDNSIGAQWYLTYKSSTAAAAAWGQDTNYGIVTLGTTATYTPKDSGGTDTSSARYYYLYVSIDSSQAFGYPEDVTRGPTIADLSLFFTADPSKRLRHGKTFTGGEQQPLDTPCGATNPNCL